MGFLSKLFGGSPAAEVSQPASAPAEPEFAEWEEDLRREVMERVKAHPRILSVTALAGELGFTAKTAENGDVTGYLNNLRADVRGSSPEEREQRIARYVASMHATLQEPLSDDELKACLRVVLRRADVVSFGFMPDNPSCAWEALPFALEVLAQDSPTSIAMLRQKSIDKHTISLSEARAIGRANMRQLPISLESYDAQASSPLFMIADGDDYEAARLLQPEWLSQLRDKVPGPPLVIAPTRSLVVIGGSGDAATVERLIKTAKAEYEASQRNITPVPYVYGDDGRLRPLELPEDHPLAYDLALSKYTLASHVYAAQKEAMQKHYDEAGIERFAATYSVVEKDTKLFSYAVWSRDVVTSLPVADTLILRDDSAEPARMIRVPFAVAREAVGALLQSESGVTPERLLTCGFPDATVLARLEAQAV